MSEILPETGMRVKSGTKSGGGTSSIERMLCGADMTGSKSPLLLAAAAIVLAVCASAETGSNGDAFPRASMPRTLTLDLSNDGQHVTATVGERIELTLGMGGFRRYGDPEISSSAVRLESTALDFPLSPGGPGYTYIFEATAEGEAQIKFRVFDLYHHELNESGYSVTIRVERGTSHTVLQLGPKVDQANTEPWKGRWASAVTSPSCTTSVPFLRESFVPSLPNLTAVEVELLAAHPNPLATGHIQMLISSEKKGIIANVSKAVSTGDCSHVLLLLPKGGVKVSPGHVYTIELFVVDGEFSWKYVVGGYRKGTASAHCATSPLPDTRSTFLFKTFGAN